MKKLLSAIAATMVLTACSGGQTEAPASINEAAQSETMPSEMTMATKTSAVLIYADWCGSCKVLDPAVKKAQSMGPIPGVEFVVLDYTDKNADNFYLQAQAAGVEQAVKAYLDGTIKTGQLLLVDMDDQTVLKAVKKDMGAAQIAASIKEAVAAS